uniref:Ankyrin-1 n=1 Tax=Culex pipiens TaxID=7175 RepID=A0A8D8CM70_CULPI
MQSEPPRKVARVDDHRDARSHSSFDLHSEPSTSGTGTNAQSGPLTIEAITGKLGGEGEEYQRLRAYMMVLEGVLGMDLWLQFEMIDAKKFEDICVFYKENWNLIQTKHSEPMCSENEKKITYGTLFGRDKSNPFMLLKYLFDFDEIKKNEEWIHGEINKIIICTNCELNVNSYEGNWLGEIGNEMHELLKLSKGKHFQLTGQEDKMWELLLEDAFERDYNKIFEAIVILFEYKKMSPILEMYHMSLKKILLNDGQIVMFSKEKPTNIPVVIKLYTKLQQKFVMQFEDISIPNNVMGNFWTQTEDFVQRRVDFETVKEFLSKLVLSVEQPNVTELRQDIVDKGINWMRTWIRPDVLGRISQPILELTLTIIKKKFDAYEKPSLKETSDGKKKNVKAHLRAIDFEAILKDITQQINDEAEKLTQRSFPPFYITRQFSNTNDVFSESEFIESLFTKNENQKCYIFSAQPGMGKTSLMQNLAFEAQKNDSGKAVFLIYLNHFRHEVPEIETLPDILKTNVFKSELSAENVELLMENSQTQIVIFFDAFDELPEKNKKRILKVIDVLRRKSNIRIVISGRTHVREELEKHLNVKSLELKPFSEKEQVEFFEKFWEVGENERSKLEEFALPIVAKLKTDLSDKVQTLIGIPLVTRTVAETFAASFNDALEQFDIIHLFDECSKKSISAMMSKKKDSEFDLSAQDVDYAYQVFALQQYFLYCDDFFSLIADRTFYETLQKFECDFHNYQSLVLECNENGPKFTHELFRDYYAAKFVFEKRNRVDKSFLDIGHAFDDTIFYFLLVMANRAGDLSTSIEKFDKSVENEISILQSCHGTFLNNIKCLHQTDGISFNNNLRCIDFEDSFRKPCLQIADKYGSKQVELLKKDNNGLHTFVESNRIDLVDQFVTDININSVDELGDTPLFLAKSFEMFKLLTDKGAYLRHTNYKEENILHKMIKKISNEQFNKVLSYMLEKNNTILDIINQCDAKGKTFLDYVFQKRLDDQIRSRIVATLIEKGASKDNVLDAAVKNGNLEIVRYLIDKRIDDSKKNCQLAGEETEALLVDIDTLLPLDNNDEKTKTDGQICRYGMAHYLHNDMGPEAHHRDIKTCYSLGIKNTADCDGRTALHIVARNDGIEAAKLLISRGAKINVKDKHDNTPLHEAIYFKSFKVAEFLIDQENIDLSIKNKSGNTVSHLAAKQKEIKLVEMLKKKLEIADENGDASDERTGDNDENTESNWITARNDNREIVKCFFRSKLKNTNVRDITALQLALESGYEKIIKLVFENNSGKYILQLPHLSYGIKNCEYHFEPFLVKMFKNSTEKCFELNYLHLYNYKVNVYQTLLEQIAAKEKKVPFGAAKNKRYYAVKMLIKNGTDINAEVECGNFPLHYACSEKDSCRLVGYLADFSSEKTMNMKNRKGKTPLHLAIENTDNYYESAAKVLIYKNANIQVSDKKLNTYLHLAIRYNKMDVAQILIDRFDPSDLNKRNKKGETALHVAVLKDKFDIVKKLVEKGIELLPIKTKEGKTASVLARDNSKTEIYDFLKRREESEDGVESNSETEQSSDS